MSAARRRPRSTHSARYKIENNTYSVIYCVQRYLKSYVFIIDEVFHVLTLQIITIKSARFGGISKLSIEL